MRSKHSVCFFVLMVSILFTFACSSPPITTTVKVNEGTIEGVEQDGIISYKGIPFAAPPVGDLRWKAPQPAEAWTGVKSADTYACGCMQDSSMAAMTGAPANFGEDCLYLNVWTGAKKADEKRPVMVWIHGGAFVGGMTGTPMFDGTKFARKGVVLVSIAYRLGVFGFMAHPELSSESGKGSGTYGLQDMIAGLKWVKDNIAQFGGDPSRVTIFGESAGGIAVGMLSAAPPAKGLFQRAISESGGSFAPPRVVEGAGMNVAALKLAESDGENFLKKLGVDSIKAARALSAEHIQKATGGGMGGGFRFWPVADGYVIPGDPYELYEKGQFNDTPILAGTNSNEGGLFMRGPVTPEQFEQQIRSGYGERADVILEAYPHATDAEAARASADVFREFAFSWPTWAWARLQSRMGKGKAFVYYYDHRTPRSPDGANHADEVSYVFGNFGGMGGEPRPEDLSLSDMIQDYWINFADKGDPNGPGLTAWPNFTEDDQKVLYFDDSAAAKPIPNLEKLKAYDAYYAWRREQAGKNSGQ
ncbi:carboxylesterase/lipase family protein [Thermodesulfobacteriota bacterium]